MIGHTNRDYYLIYLYSNIIYLEVPEVWSKHTNLIYIVIYYTRGSSGMIGQTNRQTEITTF